MFLTGLTHWKKKEDKKRFLVTDAGRNNDPQEKELDFWIFARKELFESGLVYIMKNFVDQREAKEEFKENSPAPNPYPVRWSGTMRCIKCELEDLFSQF